MPIHASSRVVLYNSKGPFAGKNTTVSPMDTLSDSGWKLVIFPASTVTVWVEPIPVIWRAVEIVLVSVIDIDDTDKVCELNVSDIEVETQSGELVNPILLGVFGGTVVVALVACDK